MVFNVIYAIMVILKKNVHLNMMHPIGCKKINYSSKKKITEKLKKKIWTKKIQP
jgi:hypothetical protein